MKSWNSIVCAAAMFIMGGLSFGCATPFEHRLGTTMEYHALLKTPIISSVSDNTLLETPHYIIGVEKAHTESVERLLPCASGSMVSESRYCLNLDAFPVTNPWRTKIATQNNHDKTLFVSHIARLDREGDSKALGGFVFCIMFIPITNSQKHPHVRQPALHIRPIL